MPKNNILKYGKMIETDKVVLGGDTTVITGEIIVDEHNHILDIQARLKQLCYN